MVSTSVSGFDSGISSRSSTIRRALSSGIMKVDSKEFESLSNGVFKVKTFDKLFSKLKGAKTYKTVSPKRPQIIKDEETGRYKLVYVR